MSNDDDAPFKHTRSSDLKRKPLPDMASRHPHAGEDTESDQSYNSSLDVSPKSSMASPRTKRRKLYPALTPEKGKNENIYPDLSVDNGNDETDSSRLNDSCDASLDDTNRSARKIKSSPRSQKKTIERIKTQPGPSPESADSIEGSWNWYILVGVGAIILSIAWFTIFNAPSIQKVPGPPSVPEIFLNNLKEIKNSYPAQDARFWKIIGSQIKRALSNDSAYPAVILLGTPQGYAALGTCFAKRVMSVVNSAAEMTGENYINTVELDQRSPGKTKYNLDENLKSVFIESKGAIIDHVDKLPAKAALLLHGYCDGDNAPFKDVVLFLILNTNLTEGSLNDKVVEKSLTELWGSELGVDEMPALCSRIANNIVVLSPEEDETLATCA